MAPSKPNPLRKISKQIQAIMSTHPVTTPKQKLRNRAPYAQAYPALELTLTDTNDKAVARRVWLPDEYLPPAWLAGKSFPAQSDLDVRLWLETREINAAGYRLYVFYP